MRQGRGWGRRSGAGRRPHRYRRRVERVLALRFRFRPVVTRWDYRLERLRGFGHLAGLLILLSHS